MFENPRSGRQTRNFTTNAPKILDLKSSSEQIFSRKLPLGAPDLFATVATIARKIITQEARTHHVNIWRRFSLKTLANKSLLMKSITGCPFWDYGFSPLGTLLEIRQYLSYRAWATCGWSGAAHFSQTCSQRPINSLNSQKRIPRNIVTIRRFNGKQAEEMFLLR